MTYMPIVAILGVAGLVILNDWLRARWNIGVAHVLTVVFLVGLALTS